MFLNNLLLIPHGGTISCTEEKEHPFSAASWLVPQKTLTFLDYFRSTIHVDLKHYRPKSVCLHIHVTMTIRFFSNIGVCLDVWFYINSRFYGTSKMHWGGLRWTSKRQAVIFQSSWLPGNSDTNGQKNEDQFPTSAFQWTSQEQSPRAPWKPIVIELFLLCV